MSRSRFSSVVMVGAFIWPQSAPAVDSLARFLAERPSRAAAGSVGANDIDFEGNGGAAAACGATATVPLCLLWTSSEEAAPAEVVEVGEINLGILLFFFAIARALSALKAWTTAWTARYTGLRAPQSEVRPLHTPFQSFLLSSSKSYVNLAVSLEVAHPLSVLSAPDGRWRRQ